MFKNMAVAIVFVITGCSADKTDTAKADAPARASSATASAAPRAENKPAAAPQRKKLSELLVGAWLYESAELPGTPEAVKKQIMAEMKKSKIEFSANKFTSYTNGKVFSSQDYEVAEEQGNKLTIKMKGGKTETYELPDDDTLISQSPELGKMVLKRSKDGGN